MIEEVTEELAIARYLAGARGRRDTSSFNMDVLPPGSTPYERAARDFTDMVMDHMFTLPRTELMIGDKSKTERMYRGMKAQALKAVDARANESVKELTGLLSQARKAKRRAENQARRDELGETVKSLRRSIRETKRRYGLISDKIDKEFKIRMNHLEDEATRDAILESGFRRASEELKKTKVHRGLRRSLDRRPQVGR